MITEKVTSVHHWSDRTFSFKTTRSQTFKFNAGEFAMCGLNIDGKNVLRAYSVVCLLYTSPSPRDRQKSRMPSSA